MRHIYKNEELTPYNLKFKIGNVFKPSENISVSHGVSYLATRFKFKKGTQYKILMVIDSSWDHVGGNGVLNNRANLSDFNPITDFKDIQVKISRQTKGGKLYSNAQYVPGDLFIKEMDKIDIIDSGTCTTAEYVNHLGNGYGRKDWNKVIEYYNLKDKIYIKGVSMRTIMVYPETFSIKGFDFDCNGKCIELNTNIKNRKETMIKLIKAFADVDESEINNALKLISVK
jgi:hypothetical protein